MTTTFPRRRIATAIGGLAMMVSASFGGRLDDHCPSPQLARSSRRVGDGGGARHAGSLGSIRIQLIGPNHADALLRPVRAIHWIIVTLEPRCR